MEHRYTPGDYNPISFSQLHSFETAQAALKEAHIQNHVYAELRALFRKHRVQARYGLLLLHRHFDMEDDEKLVEFRGIATPWKKVPASGEVFGGRVFPRCWGFFHGGELLPTEFGFDIGTECGHKDPAFTESFVQELYDILKDNGLDKLLGITVFDDNIINSPRLVERTLGRVSITFSASDYEIEAMVPLAMESAWTFGCQESMDDSDLIPGRVCWVCQGCK